VTLTGFVQVSPVRFVWVTPTGFVWVAPTRFVWVTPLCPVVGLKPLSIAHLMLSFAFSVDAMKVPTS